MQKTLFKLENLFLIICLFFGFIFVFVNPPFQSPDELEHLFKMWGYTELSLNNKVKNNWAGQILPNSFNIIYKKYHALRFSFEKTSVIETITYSKLKLNKENKSFLAFTPTSYTPISYFPSFIILFLLKLINASPFNILYILRFCSLLTYLSLSYAAIKLIPSHKWLLFTASLLPINIYQAASISTDGLCFGFILFFIAYIVYLRNNKQEIKNKNIYVLAFLTIILCFLKFSYAPLIFLFLLLPKEKFQSQKHYLYIFFSLLSIATACIIIFFLFSKNIKGLTVYIYENNLLETSIVIKNILKHPINFIINLVKTTIYLAPFYYSNVISSFGVTLAMIPAWANNLYWILLGLSVFIKNKNEQTIPLNIFQKITIIVAVTFCYICVVTSVYLVYQNEPIMTGTQGRYLTPLLPVILLILYFSKIQIQTKIVKILFVLTTIFLLFISTLSLIMRFY